MPPLPADPPITFRAAAAAAGLPESTVRNWLDRGQVTLEADAARAGGRGWRRFSTFDVIRLAIVGRAVRYGFTVEQADAVMARHFDEAAIGARIVAAMVPDASAAGILALKLGAAALVLCRDGRSALLQGMPGDAVAIVTAEGPVAEISGGTPYPGSEWLLEEAASLQDFVVVRLGAIAADVGRRLHAALNGADRFPVPALP